MHRREFLKKSCIACIAAGSIGAITTLLESCSPLSTYKAIASNGNLSVPVSAFAPEEKMKIIRTDKLDYDVLLLKNNNESYSALYMKCTHFDNALLANTKGLSCNLHGSTFDLEGKVTNGPALTNLKTFVTRKENETIIITIS